MSSYISGERLKADFREIEASVYVQAGGATVLRGGEALQVDNVGYTNGPFFDTVQLPLVTGDPRSALQNPAWRC